MLALWEGLLWVLALLGKEFSFYPLELVIMIIALYFHFQLLTDLAQIARQFPPELDEATELKPLDQRILRSRTARILLATLGNDAGIYGNARLAMLADETCPVCGSGR